MKRKKESVPRLKPAAAKEIRSQIRRVRLNLDAEKLSAKAGEKRKGPGRPPGARNKKTIARAMALGMENAQAVA